MVSAEGVVRAADPRAALLVHQHSNRRCSVAAVDQAADEGHWDVVKLIAENQSARRKATSQHAINYAARNGQLDVVKYLVESETTLW
ncbi:hypothetical protein Gpo141_00012041 [Globisporangium polare]